MSKEQLIINTTSEDIQNLDCPLDTHVALREYAELLDHLPRLADGVVAIRGMKVWTPWYRGSRAKQLTIKTLYEYGFSYDDHKNSWVRYGSAFSTREGAEAKVREMNAEK